MKILFKPADLPSFVVLITGIMGMLMFSRSPLLGGDVSQMHIDSQVYVYTATQILKGEVLYRDVFDHKGPLMYVPECIGLALSGRSFIGLWLIQLLFFVAGAAPLFIFWARKYGFFPSLTALIFMCAWIFRTKTIGDNIPEIYAVSFACLFLSCCLRLKESPNGSPLNAWLIGICGICLFLLKPNFIIVVLPCFLWLSVTLYREKNFTHFLFMLCWDA